MSFPVFCLNESFVDRDVLLLRQAIRRFVMEAKTTHSFDGYLILLGGLVFGCLVMTYEGSSGRFSRALRSLRR